MQRNNPAYPANNGVYTGQGGAHPQQTAQRPLSSVEAPGFLGQSLQTTSSTQQTFHGAPGQAPPVAQRSVSTPFVNSTTPGKGTQLANSSHDQFSYSNLPPKFTTMHTPPSSFPPDLGNLHQRQAKRPSEEAPPDFRNPKKPMLRPRSEYQSQGPNPVPSPAQIQPMTNIPSQQQVPLMAPSTVPGALPLSGPHSMHSLPPPSNPQMRPPQIAKPQIGAPMMSMPAAARVGAPSAPFSPMFSRLDRVVNESAFNKWLHECLGENEKIAIDPEAMRVFEGIIDSFIGEVGKLAGKVATHRKSGVVAGRDVGLALNKGYGMNVPGCSPGVVVPLQQSVTLSEHGRTMAAVRKTNAAANRGQLKDRGGK
ncbi:hypothetical protein BSKO_07144 [Bryopsis sp. KO-2023]|nr:hypothetical protein BSKO_07144 [Bryopsis sp. KO-2023]